MHGLKALILAGGRGNRLGAPSDTANKCMLPLLGKPLVQYSLENAVAAGVEAIVLVVGYRAEDIINHFGNEFRGSPIRYVIQAEQKGLVHAMECARGAVDGADVMLFLADEVLSKPNHDEMLRRFREEALFAVCGIVRVRDRSQIRKTYALLADEGTRTIYRLIEKPRTPINDIMGTGNCIMRAAIYDYLDRTPINVERGEKELPDLIQCAVDEGRLVKFFDIGDGYINVNTPEDIAAAERFHRGRGPA